MTYFKLLLKNIKFFLKKSSSSFSYRNNQSSIIVSENLNNISDVKISGIKKSFVKKKINTQYSIIYNKKINPYFLNKSFVTTPYNLSSKSLVPRINYNKILKCFMHRSTGAFNYVSNIVAPKIKCNTVIKRYLPDQGYKAYRITAEKTGKNEITGHNIYDTEASTATGQEIPQHEKSHIIVRDNETGLDVALLTSAKNPGKGNEFLAKENVKGDILPNGTPKPQYIIAFKEPRYSQESLAYKEDTKATSFLKKYDKEVNKFVKKSGTYKRIPLYRTTKDSSKLYHPNGKPIYDNNGKEIDYYN